MCSAKYLGDIFDYCDPPNDFANDPGFKDLTNEPIATDFD